MVSVSTFDSTLNQYIRKAVKFDEILTGVDVHLSKLVSDMRNAKSVMKANAETTNQCFAAHEETMAKLVVQKDALQKKLSHLLKLSESMNESCEDKDAKEKLRKSLHKKLARLDEECCSSMKRAAFYDRENQTIASLKSKIRQNIDEQNKLVEKDLLPAVERMSLLNSVSGVQVKSVVGKHQLVIELLNPPETESVSASLPESVNDEFLLMKQPPPGLEVTITFTQQTGFRPRISDVHVNEDLLSADDLIERAVSTNDTAWLLASLRQRWFKQRRLASEIDVLSHRYALDWQFTKGLVQVLYGRDASIVCTLDLHDYPDCNARGITLQSASGLPSGVTFESIQIPSSCCLKSALEFLDGRLSTVNNEHSKHELML